MFLPGSDFNIKIKELSGNNGATGGTWRGNYTGYFGMINKFNSELIITPSQDNRGNLFVNSGTNIVNFTSLQSNKWIYLLWSWGCHTSSATLSNIRLLFNNNQSLTIEQAVNNGYIEPLVTYISADTSRVNDMSYVLDNPEQLISGGSQTKAYSSFNLAFKVKNLSPLKGISFESTGFSQDTNICSDGFYSGSDDAIEFSS